MFPLYKKERERRSRPTRTLLGGRCRKYIFHSGIIFTGIVFYGGETFVTLLMAAATTVTKAAVESINFRGNSLLRAGITLAVAATRRRSSVFRCR